MFLCPVCGKPLDDGAKTRTCPNGHCYDRSAHGGYVNLLKTNRRGSAVPGDSPEMCRARTRFLEKGYYSALRDALCDAVSRIPSRRILDAGCGEGYYTAAVAETLRGNGSSAQILGVDLSKAALRRAGKRCPEAEFALASLFALPLADHAVDVVLHLFAPMCAPEFRRVLSEGGTLITVKPGSDHLWGLKQALYERPYPNDEEQAEYPDFQWMGRTFAEDEITIDCGEDIQALYQMTPYAWKTAKDAAERLRSLDTLTTKISFVLDLYLAV